MKIILKSDFLDYYDHWFAPSIYRNHSDVFIYERYSIDSFDRKWIFNHLQNNGFITPYFGQVSQLYAGLNNITDTPIDEVQVVIYHDLYAHRGEAKEKLSIVEAYKRYPNTFASLWMQPYVRSNIESCSYRYLQIGNKFWWLEYSSKDDWRSNCGDVHIRIIDDEEIKYKNILGRHFMTGNNNTPPVQNNNNFHPLFAIDFVFDGKYSWAVDLNHSPQIRGTGIEEKLSSKECYQLIEEGILNSYNSSNSDVEYQDTQEINEEHEENNEYLSRDFIMDEINKMQSESKGKPDVCIALEDLKYRLFL